MQMALHAQVRDFKNCGISDIDQIRREVKSSPTTADGYLNRGAALSRWWRLLWHQEGFDMSACSETVEFISF
jgi:hypothetical protein